MKSVHILYLGLFSMTAILVACSGFLGAENSEMNTNREKWESQWYGSYQFEYQQNCFCPASEPVILTVEDGIIESARLVGTGELVNEADFSQYRTIERLLEILQGAIESSADKFSVEYDSDLGYPIFGDIDYEERAVDSEFGFTVSDLQAR